MKTRRAGNAARFRTSIADGVAEWDIYLPPNRTFELEELEYEIREEIRIREQAYRPLAEA